MSEGLNARGVPLAAPDLFPFAQEVQGSQRGQAFGIQILQDAFQGMLLWLLRHAAWFGKLFALAVLLPSFCRCLLAGQTWQARQIGQPWQAPRSH